jgi:Helicase subunit of the DNA excision repair complex
MEYNLANGIEPKQIEKKLRNVLGRERIYESENVESGVISDPLISLMKPEQIREAINSAKIEMERAAADLDFIQAAKFRDQMNALKKLLEKKI